jgi:hypothetical protein
MAQSGYKTPGELGEEVKKLLDLAYTAAHENSERLRSARLAEDTVKVAQLSDSMMLHNSISHLLHCAKSDIDALLKGDDNTPEDPA